MLKRTIVATLTAAVLLTHAAVAVETTLQLQLSTSGDFERRTIIYDCGTEVPLEVAYLNAAPNFLAVLSVPDRPDPLVFTAVLSASGVRYAAGQWIWWSKGPDATLSDLTLGDDAEAVLTCSEFNNTP